MHEAKHEPMVKLISIPPEPEYIIGYCARVSNPKNQENPDVFKLISYCVKNKHWSIFEMQNIVLEITTSRAIAAQILRHKSFSFQEFSQRYSESDYYIETNPRKQDLKNRQHSTDDLPFELVEEFQEKQRQNWIHSYEMYKYFTSKGVAKESARFLLPLSTGTKLYMNGNIRSWIHYCILRCDSSTQLEHRVIAQECWKIIRKELPNVANAVEDNYPVLKEVV